MNTLKILSENRNSIPDDLYFKLVVSINEDINDKVIQSANFIERRTSEKIDKLKKSYTFPFTMLEKEEVLKDMSKIIGKDIEIEINTLNSFFGGVPIHDNFYHILKHKYEVSNIPQWFFDKYPEVADKYYYL